MLSNNIINLKSIQFVFFFICIFEHIIVNAQLIVGANTIDHSAILELVTSDKGFLPPRISLEQRPSIKNPAEGLVIYNTTNKQLEIYDGNSWLNALDGSQAPFKYSIGYIHCDYVTEVVDVTNPVTSRIWMDRNLGASRVATSSIDTQSYGSLFQWGRPADGHQCVNRSPADLFATSGTTSVRSNSSQPSHPLFITPISPSIDWLNPFNRNLWQGTSGINNPCPDGYRIPTIAEWTAELQSWSQAPISSTEDAAGAFTSPLRLPLAGKRSMFSGLIQDDDEIGSYWSSSVFLRFDWPRYFSFTDNEAFVFYQPGSYGRSVRCIKD